MGFVMNKKILIVDDSDLNNELIEHLLGSYSRDKDVPLNIFKANDGKQAVEICDENEIDIVFMDYMMPVMDGNEATKIIKKNHPKIMIIVVSTIGDEKQQKEMLLSGAEDYITKPIVASVFKSRFNNYMQLVHNRNHIGSDPKSINLITSKVYSYHMDFRILSEEELSEFWEAMLLRFNFQNQIENLNDLVRFLYALGMLQLHQKFQFNIIIEESVENFYFTINGAQLIGCVKIDSIVKKYLQNATYVCKGNKLTFALAKQSKTEFFAPLERNEENGHKVKDVEITYVSDANETLQTYDILDADELNETEEFLIKIKSIVLLMENSNLELDEIEYLCNYFNSIASILSASNDTYVISNALHGLAVEIAQNANYFSENSQTLFEFTNAFANDLLFWKTKIFYEGAPSVDFLNDSITTNANMLNSLLKPDDGSVEDLDDIFDF